MRAHKSPKNYEHVFLVIKSGTSRLLWRHRREKKWFLHFLTLWISEITLKASRSGQVSSWASCIPLRPFFAIYTHFNGLFPFGEAFYAIYEYFFPFEGRFYPFEGPFHRLWGSFHLFGGPSIFSSFVEINSVEKKIHELFFRQFFFHKNGKIGKVSNKWCANLSW